MCPLKNLTLESRDHCECDSYKEQMVLQMESLLSSLMIKRVPCTYAASNTISYCTNKSDGYCLLFICTEPTMK